MSLRPTTPIKSALLLTALLVISLGVTTPVGAADGVATSSDRDAADSVEITTDRDTVHRGAMVNVTVSLPPDGTATLWLQRTTNAVTSGAEVRDGGDGEVHLRLNTYDGSWTVTSTGDRLLEESRNPWRAVRPTKYALSVGTEDSGARTTFEVRPLTLDGLSAWRAPTQAVPFESAADVRRAIDDGTVEQATGLREDDTLVLRLDATTLEGGLVTTSGANATDRFLRLFARDGTIELRQTNPAPERPAAVVDVLNGSGVTVYPDHTAGAYFLAVDLADATVYRGDDPVTDFDYADARFVATVSLDENGTANDASERVAAFVDSDRAWVDTPAEGTIRLDAAGNRTITGTTTVDAGRTLTVRLHGVDDPQTTVNESFVRQQTVVVNTTRRGDVENRFEATFDLTATTPGTRTEIDVLVGNRSLLDGQVFGRVVATETTTTRTTTSTATTSETSTPTTTTPRQGTTASRSATSDATTDTAVPGLDLRLGTFAVLTAALLAVRRCRTD